MVKTQSNALTLPVTNALDVPYGLLDVRQNIYFRSSNYLPNQVTTDYPPRFSKYVAYRRGDK